MEHQVVSFSAEDLIRVLRVCRKANVTELKIGDIEVKFGGDTPSLEQARPANPALSDVEFKESERQVNIDENLNEAEDRLDLLQIEDPALYERLVLERELEDNGHRAEVSEH